MGAVGRYLDLLPAKARERLYTATRWTTYAYVDHTGARNLLGHAEDWRWPDPQTVPVCAAPDIFSLREAAGDVLWTDDPLIGARFARLVQRRGLDAAVCIVRARLNGRPPRITRVHRRGHLTLVL
jgi:hypothetical protein